MDDPLVILPFLTPCVIISHFSQFSLDSIAQELTLKNFAEFYNIFHNQKCLEFVHFISKV